MLFYGHGQAIFGNFLAAAEPEIMRNVPTPLCKIMHAEGSDKGCGHHNYTQLYHRLFSQFLHDPTDVFELGIGSTRADLPANMGPGGVPGASLRGWRRYFPGATICGADIDGDILFQEQGIQTLYVDQTDPASVMSLWAHLSPMYDLIVDDGLHQVSANTTFLFGSKHKLKPGGLYIIEDIWMSSDNLASLDAVLNTAVMSGFLYRVPYGGNYNDNAVAVLCGPNWTG